MIAILLAFCFSITCFAEAGKISGGAKLSGGGQLSSVVAWDTDASNYFANIITAGSSISARHQVAINTFVVNAKSGGYWTNLLEINPMAGRTLEGAKVKLKYLLVATNREVNFVAGDYSQDVGITGALTKYLHTDVNVTNVGATIGLSVFLNQDNVTFPGLNGWIGKTVVFNADDRAIWTSAAVLFLDNNFQAIIAQVFNYSSGLYHNLRQSSVLQYFLINGVVINSRSTSSTTAANGEITVFGLGGGSITTNKLCYYAIDDGTMGTNKAILYGEAVRMMVQDMGRRQPNGTARFVPFVGQSLANGVSSNPAITDRPDTTNNNRTLTTSPTGAAPNNTRPANLILMQSITNGVEAPESRFAMSFTNMISASWGLDGTALSGITAGSAPYIRSTNEWVQLMRPKGIFYDYFKTIQPIDTMFMLHGESDYTNTTYDVGLLAYRTNYEGSLINLGLLQPTNHLTLFVSQTAIWTLSALSNGITNDYPSQIGMNLAALNDPYIHVVFPKYMIDYYTDNLHPTNTGQYMIGQLSAKVYQQHVLNGIPWQDFRPTNIARTGPTVTLTLPRDNIVVDTNIVSEAINYGFKWWESPPGVTTISSVALSGATTNQVVLTLSGTPSGSNRFVSYADTGTNLTANGVNATNTGASRVRGPRGNIRNQDTIPDWLLVFKLASP